MTEPKQGRVTVVIPVYQGELFIASAVQSALAQTHPDVEIVAVNDGSSDGSVEVLRQFGPRVRVISQQNTGVAGARNRGIESATGEFIAFLDQDDWWGPTKVERQLAVFAADARIGLVHTGVAHIDSASGREVGALNPLSRPAEMVGDCYRRLLLGNPIYNSSVMVRRDAVVAVGGCDISLAGNTVADYDLWLRISRQYHLGFINEPLTYYRLHPHQGIRDRRSMLTAEIEVLLRIQEEAQWGQEPEMRERLARLYDELAVAHYDANDYSSARRRFADAFRIAPSARAGLRCLASYIPPSIVRWTR